MSVASAKVRPGGARDAGSGAEGAGPTTRATASGSARSVGRTAAVPMPTQRVDDKDPYEREAASAAASIVAGQDPVAVTSLADGTPAQRAVVGEDETQRVAVGEDEVQRVAVGEEELQRAPLAGGTDSSEVSGADLAGPNLAGPAVGGAEPGGTDVASTVRSPGPGRPIPTSVREAIEPRLGVSLEGVAVHTGPRAAAAAADLQARAFTSGRDIFLGEGESPHDLGLMAHEATHTVQQGSAGGGRRTMSEPQRLAGAIRSGLARFARHIPGYTLLCVLIGTDPLAGTPVPRSAENLVGGLLGLVPFGTVIFDKLVELGVIGRALAFVQSQLARFDLSVSRIERMLSEAWDEMDFKRLDPFAHNLGILTRRFARLVADVTAFARSLVDAVMELIREAVIGVAEGLLADVPAWSLIKKVLGRDPLRDEPVDATTEEILADFLLLIGREQELEQMRERDTLREAAAWIDTQIATFMGLLGELGAIFSAAWEAIQPSNLPNLASNLRNLATRVVGLLGRAWDFAWEVAAKALEFIKKALLNWLSDVVHEAPGFHLLTVILERNPFTDEHVPRTAENLIRGFITLLPGGGAAYDQLSESGVIGEAAGTIEGAMSELGISWEMVTGLFRAIWDGLSIGDLIDPIGAFLRIRAQFGEPLSRIFAFIRVVLTEVIGLILKLMNFPSQVLGSIIANVTSAYEDIKNDPVQFLLNLLATVKEGFTRFFSGIFGHLLRGLTDWLFRGLRSAGIEPPSEITLQSALDLVMQVLGLTVDRMWQKLAERIGQDRVDQIRGAIDRLQGIWTFVRDVQERGPSAIWEHIQSRISGLWDTLLQQARDWVMTTIVQRVTAKLLSMLDPTGVMAVVNSFVAFFNAIQSAIEYIRDLLDIVDQWAATLAAVARGDVEPGAARLELGLISAIPVAIGFLANQVGLGDIGGRITEIIGGLRSMVDQALDWLLDQAERLLHQVMSALGFGAEAEEVGDTGDPEHDAAVAEGLAAIADAEAQYIQSGSISREDAEQVALAVLGQHAVFSSLTVVDGGDSWNYRWTASDGDDHDTPSKKAEASPFVGREVTEPTLAADLAATGYVGPYTQGSIQVIRRKSASSSLEKLSVNSAGVVQSGPASDQASSSISQPDWVPESGDVKYGSARSVASSPVGTSMEIAPLTSKGPEGSTVSNNSALWSILRRRAEVTRTYWVQGHLLNRRLHGPGNNPQNLTPLTQTDNASHESLAESDVKAAVLRSGEDVESPTAPVVRYTVSVSYGSTPYPTTGYDPPVLETLAAESQLATALTCEAWYLQDDGSGTWKVTGDRIVGITLLLRSPAPPPEFVPRSGT